MLEEWKKKVLASLGRSFPAYQFQFQLPSFRFASNQTPEPEIYSCRKIGLLFLGKKIQKSFLEIFKMLKYVGIFFINNVKKK